METTPEPQASDEINIEDIDLDELTKLVFELLRKDQAIDHERLRPNEVGRLVHL